MECTASLADGGSYLEERKVVTVLFADLVGFTSRSEAMDVEDVRGTLQPYHELLRRELERYGGTVEKFIGDAVMAVFGAPTAHEDDPERAVRAALSIQDAIVRLRETDPQLDLHVRIGVNTGEALVALDAKPAAGEGMASGDVVNTAARMQSAAPVDGVLVGEVTYRATGRAVEYAAAEPIAAKGKTGLVPVWVAHRVRAQLGSDVFRDLETPLVGRDRELGVLVDALELARSEATPRLVTVLGVPGIGKSRLTYELLRCVEEDPDLITWRQGRSLPYGEGVSFWAFGEIVKAQAGILHSDSAETTAEKLREAVIGLIEEERDAGWVEQNLYPLLGLTSAGELRGDRQAEAFAAWRRFVEALAAQRPTVLVFEDLHWADDALLDFLDYLVEWVAGVPLLIVSTARPELIERRRAFGGGTANATRIALSPLSDEETARLVAGLLEQAVLPAETQAAVLRRAEGNPLYAQEYVRMLQDQGLLVRDGDVWVLRQDVELPLPGNVQSLIAARIDALPAEEKAVVQDASVMGKVVWASAVGHIAGRGRWAVEEALHRLAAKQFLRQARSTSVEGETEYAFAHALIRDVAYQRIVRRARAEKHARAAEWVVGLATDRSDRAEMLAHHYWTALELTRAVGADTDSLAAKALDALITAGERALTLHAFSTAQGSFERALGLADDLSERGAIFVGLAKAEHRQFESPSARLWEARDAVQVAGMTLELAEIEAMIGVSLANNGRVEEGFQHASDAAQLAEGLSASPTKGWILNQLASFYAQLPSLPSERAVELATEALSIGDELADDDIQMQALLFRGQARLSLEDPSGMDDVERSVEMATMKVTSSSLVALNNAAAQYWKLAELQKWRNLCLILRERARELGNAFWGDVADVMVEVVARYEEGEWDEALEGIRRSAGASVSGPVRPYYESWATARIAASRGEIAAANAAVEQVLATGEAQGQPSPLAGARALAGIVALRDAATDKARVHAAEALAVWLNDPLGSGWMLRDLMPLLPLIGRTEDVVSTIDQMRLHSGWHEAALAIAERDYRRAAAIYERVGARPAEAEARLDAADALIHQGEIEDGDRELDRSLAFWRSVGATAEIAKAELLRRRQATG
jgi:class 3 adenylate cyclase/tetratricopeptide (TPR) repeat protein